MSTNTSTKADDPLYLPLTHQQALEPYLPPPRKSFLPANPEFKHTPIPSASTSLPHVTLTYASSLDAQIALSPGQQTVLSGKETKAMTHYLRSRHDAILVGVGTAVADDPGLNCRWAPGEGEGEEGAERIGGGLDRQPIPLILDPSGRWKPGNTQKAFGHAKEGRGRGAWWLVGQTCAPPDIPPDLLQIIPLARYHSPDGGKSNGLDWERLLRGFAERGIRSVMIEGGGEVIKDLLRERNKRFVSSVILTVAPVWLGKGGVEVVPEREGHESQGLRLSGTKWIGMGGDVVCCGFLEEKKGS